MKEIFANNKNIAVVGMTDNPKKPSNSVPMYMIRQGFNVTPVNPTIESAAGRKSYPSLLDVPDPIHIVNVFRRSEFIPEIVEQAIERHKNNGDVNVIWLQEGIVSPESRALAEENGIIFIEDLCMFKEFDKLYTRSRTEIL